ncbi:MAG: hypothetical protein MO853_12210 [Candidatus Protistobacter heckmanni]|nr:hypothetical protein [Candidatus Protistobacter heckmanni]
MGKILLVVTAAVAMCLVISTLRTQRTLRKYQRVAEVNFPNISSLGAMELAGEKVSSATNLLIDAPTTAEDTANASRLIDAAVKQFDANAKDYESLHFVDGRKRPGPSSGEASGRTISPTRARSSPSRAPARPRTVPRTTNSCTATGPRWWTARTPPSDP